MKKLFVFDFTIDPNNHSKENLITYTTIAESFEDAMSEARKQYPDFSICSVSGTGDLDEEGLARAQEQLSQQRKFV